MEDTIRVYDREMMGPAKMRRNKSKKWQWEWQQQSHQNQEEDIRQTKNSS